MQGKWKNDLGSWNSKDTKRKSQTRNQYLKDRGLWYSRSDYKDLPIHNIRVENEVQHFDEEKVYKKSGWIETWRISVSRYTGQVDDYNSLFIESIYSGNIRTAYWNNGWRDEYTNEPIIGDIRKLSFLWKEEVQFDIPEEEPKRKRQSWYYSSSKEILFIDDKPVSSWKRWTFYNDGKRRKFAQKYATSMDRQNTRNWITKEEWDTEIKTHALSKSIAWEVH